jgi:tRNA pseudouridine38-40 synthase
VPDSPALALAQPCELEAEKASDLGGELKRMALGIAYDGRSWQGWQKQTHGLTVQDTLERALQAFVGGPVETICAGRTDTGVHARQYFAHFETENELDTGKFCYQLNAILPKDIAVYRAFKVADRFHARFDAISRSYEYHISNRLNPFLQELSWCFYRDLDIKKMNEAASLLKNYSDFECFSKVFCCVSLKHLKPFK